MAESDFVVSTVVGCLEEGFLDGRGINAKFCAPLGLAFNKDGGILTADRWNHCIRKVTINGGSPAQVETFAGVPGQSGYRDGEAANALFNAPCSVSVSNDGTVYVADSGNYRLRTIDNSKTVRTLAGSGRNQVVDGKGGDASFMDIYGISCIRGGDLFVVGGSCVLRRVTKDGVVSTVAGTPCQSGQQDGDLRLAKFSSCVLSIACNFSGSGRKFMADTDNHAIRFVDPDGIVGTIAGGNGSGFLDGSIDLSMFNHPVGVAVDEDGQIFVADFENHRIRMVSPGTDGVPVVSTIAGCGEPGLRDGPGKSARLMYPLSLHLDLATSTLYFTQRHCLRKISLPKKHHPKLESSMLRDLQSLTTDDTNLADVMFTVEGKPIYAYKALLSVRSQYFNRMFSSGMKESVHATSSAKVTEIPVEDVDYESFKALVVYLTTDQLTVDFNDYKRMCQLLVACDQFMVDRLKVHCERVLGNQIQAENVFELVQLADLHGAEHLKDAALKYVAQHISDLCDKPEMSQLPPQFLVDVIKISKKL